MNEPPPSVMDWLGLSGLLALGGAVFGYGRLQQRIDQHAVVITRLEQTAETLARLDERLKHVKDDVADIKETLRAK